MEMIHPGGFFPAAHPLPTPAQRERAEALLEDADEGWIERGDAVPPPWLAPLSRAAAARARMDRAAAEAELAHVEGMAGEMGGADLRAALANERAAVAILQGGDADASTLRALAESGDADAAQRGRAAVNLGVLAGLAGEAEEALAWLDRGEAVATDAGDEHGLVLLGANRARVLAGVLDLPGAWRAAADALRRARRVKDEHGTAVGLMATALVDLARGSRNEARRRLGDALRAFARTGDVLRQVQCCHVLGEIAYDGEDPIRAGALYRDGLALARAAAANEAVDRLTLLFEHR
jgi:tetratricopeptide (TPR) repeat protein